MEFQEIFEDLESAFVQHKHDWRSGQNCLRVQTLTNQTFDLLAPIIGIDFVAGLDRAQGDWLLFALGQCKELQSQVIEDDLPAIRAQEIELQEFIKTLEKPVRVSVLYVNQSEHSLNILDFDRHFLFAENRKLIPVKSIQQLRVLGTNKWQ